MSRLSIKSKLLLMLLLVSILSMVLVGGFAYRSAQRTIEARIFDQLTSLRASRAYEIESYLASIAAQVQSMGEDFTVSRAMQEFRLALPNLERRGVAVSSEQLASLSAFYESEFLPRLEETIDADPVVETYLPASNIGRYLQTLFIAENPNPVGEKAKLTEADTGGYSATHRKYHETFRNIAEVFGYYDVFLVEIETGTVAYSVHKEVDFATNLYDGPYDTSGLAEAVRAVRDAKDPGFISVVDFSFYRPSYNAPAAFIATPIYRNNRLIGALAVQLPADEIERIMTGGRNWAANGLGETGETFLVGQDGLMRSTSRFLIEEPDEYLKTMRGTGTSDEVLEQMAAFDTTVLLQQVANDSTAAALRGERGIHRAEGYHQVPVLSAYAPLDIRGLNWAIIAEIDLAEAYAPLDDFRRTLIIVGAGLALFITLLAMLLSTLLTRPISAFIEATEEVTAGKRDVIAFSSEDEFGTLATSLNTMVTGLKQQTEVAVKKNEAISKLLHSVLPARVVTRLTRGDTDIVERYPNVSVLYADLLGATRLSETYPPEEVMELLNELVGLFDEAAQDHGVEKIKTVGGNFVAVCGVAESRLDHARRTVEFAQEMMKKLAFFNRQHGTDLHLAVGIASGTVVAGVIGLYKLIYDLTGEPVDAALRLSTGAAAGTILVSVEVRDAVGKVFTFTEQGGAWALPAASSSASAERV